MEVILEKTILQLVGDEIRKAKASNRKIKHIILSDEEWRELTYWSNTLPSDYHSLERRMGIHEQVRKGKLLYEGVTLIRADLAMEHESNA